MVAPNKILEILNGMYKDLKNKYPFIHEQILKSTIAYKILYYIEFGKVISVKDVLEEYDGEIGLIGPGDGCFTFILEKLFGEIRFFHLHSAFHDAYGRFYTKYKKGRGYCYVIPKNMTTPCLKNSSILGHLSSLFWSIIHSSEY